MCTAALTISNSRMRVKVSIEMKVSLKCQNYSANGPYLLGVRSFNDKRNRYNLQLCPVSMTLDSAHSWYDRTNLFAFGSSDNLWASISRKYACALSVHGFIQFYAELHVGRPWKGQQLRILIIIQIQFIVFRLQLEERIKSCF